MDDADDDYWNTSETKAQALIFDDDVLSPQEILAIGQKPYSGEKDGGVFSSVISVKTTLLPLNTLVAPKVLDLIVQAQSGKEPKGTKRELEQTVANSIQRLVLGRSCWLQTHRSRRSKTALLDAAIAVGDGNSILTVLLFLIQTLNKRLVYELLSSRPLALNLYISFLQNEGKITELADLLTMLGRSPEAAMYQFQHHVKTQGNNVDGLLRKMSNLLSNHFDQPGVDAYHCKMVAEYVKLLEWQKFTLKAELNNKSTLYCLAYCCLHHWHEGAGNITSPLTLCQRHQVSPIQYDWVALNVHAKAGKWDIVESFFTKKDWLGRTTLSSHIPMETLLSRLSELEASKQLLATCVQKAGDDKLRLALAYKIHSVVIETLAKQKDRAALTNYKMTLSPQSEEYILAENTLRDTSIKWKN
ncbi:spermatogenesis-defective protein 39 homolog [Hyposmocoma kahamanoa]|uniref:spermatogenesis-defective protein 39 homolog n=1 Tax=Hyposmocoma kahamanoa TaxID=1477025 RepID=UPI000E6D997F|nr:spermatogenesis-defective protein 39 homolog [Hyposmocoma kahamanoa]